MGSRARDRQPGGALRRGAVERTPTPDEDAAGRRATAGAVARTPQRARGQGRHRRRRTISHPDAWMRSTSAGGRTPGRSGSPLYSAAAWQAAAKQERGGAGRVVGDDVRRAREIAAGAPSAERRDPTAKRTPACRSGRGVGRRAYPRRPRRRRKAAGSAARTH